MAGRVQDRGLAEQHLGEAQRFATRTGEAPRVHGLSFGPSNVGRPRVSVQAELDEYGRGVETAGRFGIPSGWPASRRA